MNNWDDLVTEFSIDAQDKRNQLIAEQKALWAELGINPPDSATWEIHFESLRPMAYIRFTDSGGHLFKSEDEIWVKTLESRNWTIKKPNIDTDFATLFFLLEPYTYKKAYRELEAQS